MGPLSQLYSDCDIFVAPSISESIGLIYLEAMAYAKPVVAFHTGAVPEVIAHSETGILVERGSTAELANALVRLAGDAVLRQELGKRGLPARADKIHRRAYGRRNAGLLSAGYRRVRERPSVGRGVGQPCRPPA